MPATANRNGSSGDYSDFSEATGFANFQLIVEGKTLYVNAHMLANASPVLAELCFDEAFKEKKEQKADIAEEKHKDILEMLQCLLGGFPKNLYLNPITASNVCQMIRLSAKFQIAALSTACERFIEETYTVHMCRFFTRLRRMFNDELMLMINVLKAAVRYNLSATTVALLTERTAFIDDETLATADLDDLPGPILHRLMVAKVKEAKKQHEKQMAEAKKKHDEKMAEAAKKHKEEMAQAIAAAMSATPTDAISPVVKRKKARRH